jgi:predicted DNA-binding WGR domain protein
MRRFEFVDSTSNKFWEVKTEGPKLLVRFGRIGGTWQESDKLLADAEKANAEMEKLIREKTRKGYLEVGGKPEVKVLAKVAPKKTKTKEPKPQSMEATISPGERKAKAQKVLLMFANGQWDLAHNILENAQDEEWLFEQLLNGCKIEDGQPIPSNAIKKAIKEDEKSNPVLAMLNIMLCIPHGSELLKTFKFEKLKGELEFRELTSLSDGAAEALSKHEGELNLGGLTSLVDSPGHIALVKNLALKNEYLYLGSLTHLSDAAAEALTKHKKYKEYLNLSGLKHLTDAGAEALGKHWGDLDLSGLKSLSDAGAEVLSKHKGGLDLSGLESLSDAGAEALSKHKGDLDLSGLESLSDAGAEALSKHKGGLKLIGLQSLSEAAEKALSKNKGYVGIEDEDLYP